MKLQFNAFIPGFLGMPLETVGAFNNRIALENDANSGPGIVNLNTERRFYFIKYFSK